VGWMSVWEFLCVFSVGCAFVVVVFVALVGGDLFVHSSVRGVCFVGFGAALCVLCEFFVFVDCWCLVAMMLVVVCVYFVRC